VKTALRGSLASENTKGKKIYRVLAGLDSIVSLLIHDIFGGEILKTPMKNGWHFYNRIEGNRIDFTNLNKMKSSEALQFEDIPSGPAETRNYFAREDYYTFFMRFILIFEEIVGLNKLQPDQTN